MKILALMPTQKIMEIPAVQSLTAFQADVYRRKDALHIAFVNGFNPVLARTKLFEYAVKEEADWVIWLDSDHIYKAKDMYALIEKCDDQGLPMLSATYYVRTTDKITAHGKYLESGAFQKFSKSELNGSLVEADVIGFGFVVMRHSFMKTLYDKYKDDLFRMDATANSTEDVYFCRKAKEAGHKILFDPSIVVGHLTTVVNA